MMHAAGESAVPSGTYVSWLLSKSCSALVKRWCERVGIVEPLPVGEHHCTVMYSPKRALCPSMHGDRPLPSPYGSGYSPVAVGMPLGTDVLGPQDKAGALVVILDAAPIVLRHQYYQNEHYLKHSYPEYLPHVTLSYVFNKQDPRVMLDVLRHPLPVPLVFDTEHVDWCDKPK